MHQIHDIGLINLVSVDNSAILQYERDVINSVALRQATFTILAIRNNHQPGNAHMRLSGGVPMQVRMEPVKRSRLIDGNFRLPAFTCCDHIMRPTVQNGGNEKTMPMKGCFLIHTIFNGKRDRLSILQADNRAKISPVNPC